MSYTLPLFTIVIATRERPALFGLALDSVLAQSFADKEIVVVDDGSAPEHLPAYRAHWQRAADLLGTRFRQYSLVRRPKGHGPSYALNFGVDNASGEYVTFLDDDDLWIDAQHLARVAGALTSHAAQGKPVDMYMANQNAFTHDGSLVGTLWLGGLQAKLLARDRQPGMDGCYEVSVDELLLASGFCHLNCLTVRRALYVEVGGMDESVRWEGDRDLYLKLIDAAVTRLHHPGVVGRHHVPNPDLKANVTTSLSMVEKRLQQCIVLDRSFMRAQNPLIRQHAAEHKAYALKRIAMEFAQQGDWVRAVAYATQGLAIAPGLKWLTFCGYCMVRRVLKP
jgi:hypothetical protein